MTTGIRLRRIALGASLALGLATAPATVLATTDAAYAVKGFEYAATTTVGSFAGGAIAADDFGTWKAMVVHGPLATIVGTSSAITGGTVTLDGQIRDLAGAIDRGSITLLTDSSCGRQTFSVLAHLNLTSGGTGDADAAMLLTHYRLLLFGHCITYAATVQGSVTFHFP